jgi:hypothetical protein
MVAVKLLTLYSIKVSCVPYFRSVGVSNFNVHHLEGLRSKGLPTPSVNQIELHPWYYKSTLYWTEPYFTGLKLPL